MAAQELLNALQNVQEQWAALSKQQEKLRETYKNGTNALDETQQMIQKVLVPLQNPDTTEAFDKLIEQYHQNQHTIELYRQRIHERTAQIRSSVSPPDTSLFASLTNNHHPTMDPPSNGDNLIVPYVVFPSRLRLQPNDNLLNRYASTNDSNRIPDPHSSLSTSSMVTTGNSITNGSPSSSTVPSTTCPTWYTYYRTLYTEEIERYKTTITNLTHRYRQLQDRYATLRQTTNQRDDELRMMTVVKEEVDQQQQRLRQRSNDIVQEHQMLLRQWSTGKATLVEVVNELEGLNKRLEHDKEIYHQLSRNIKGGSNDK